jgi:SAM-dependent methyltransferase
VALPVAGGSMAAVVSMQVIEHLWDQPRHLAECRRVLRPGGTLVVSTPNRLTFSPGYDPATDRPRNIYHSREYAAAELSALVGRTVGPHTVYGLRAGARLRELDRRCRAAWRLDLVEAQLARPAEEWPAELTAMVASVRADDFALSTADPDTSLDLIVLATRL